MTGTRWNPGPLIHLWRDFCSRGVEVGGLFHFPRAHSRRQVESGVAFPRRGLARPPHPGERRSAATTPLPPPRPPPPRPPPPRPPPPRNRRRPAGATAPKRRPTERGNRPQTPLSATPESRPWSSGKPQAAPPAMRSHPRGPRTRGAPASPGTATTGRPHWRHRIR